MTPAQHLAEAERLLASMSAPAVDMYSDVAIPTLLAVLDHAIIAAAAELGVPHAGTTAGGEAGAAVQGGPGA